MEQRVAERARALGTDADAAMNEVIAGQNADAAGEAAAGEDNAALVPLR